MLGRITCYVVISKRSVRDSGSLGGATVPACRVDVVSLGNSRFWSLRGEGAGRALTKMGNRGLLSYFGECCDEKSALCGNSRDGGDGGGGVCRRRPIVFDKVCWLQLAFRRILEVGNCG